MVTFAMPVGDPIIVVQGFFARLENPMLRWKEEIISMNAHMSSHWVN